MNSGLALLENTVLTNFALISRADLVFNLCESSCATTAAVISEYKIGVVVRGLPADIWQPLKCLTLSFEEKTLPSNYHFVWGRGNELVLP
jgi:hypothetical protein